MIVLGLLAILLVIVQSCSQPKVGIDLFSKGTLKRLSVLDAPPDRPRMNFATINGTQMKLSDYEGKIILLNVWATWCAPCIAEMPTLDRLQLAMGDENFEVITISMDRTANDAKLWFEENGISALTPWHDTTYSISGKLRLPGLPTSVLYDVDGREVARLPGEADWSSSEAKSLISYLVQQN